MSKERIKQLEEVLAQHGTMTGDTSEREYEELSEELEQLKSAPAAKDGEWSGWATHVQGKLPKLYGDRGIAELNWDKENGADLIKLSVSTRVKP